MPFKLSIGNYYFTGGHRSDFLFFFLEIFFSLTKLPGHCRTCVLRARISPGFPELGRKRPSGFSGYASVWSLMSKSPTQRRAPRYPSVSHRMGVHKTVSTTDARVRCPHVYCVLSISTKVNKNHLYDRRYIMAKHTTTSSRRKPKYSSKL